MTQVTPIPAGFSTVTPHLVCEGASDAIAFYQRAFGAEDMGQMPGPDGKLMHAQIKIGNAIVMLVDDFPDWGSLGPKALKGSPVVLHLYVDDTDAWFQRAVDAGATPKMPPADMFWGDRYGQVVDPFGHTWSIATHQRDMTPQQMQEEMAKQMPGCPDQ